MKMMQNIKAPLSLFTIITLILLLLQSCASKEVQPEPPLDYWQASEELDYTALVQACDEEITTGFAYCRRPDGASTKDDMITFLAPAVSCKEPPCVYVKIFNSAGKPIHSLAFPQGVTRMEASWMTLTKKDRFSVGDRGFWPFFYEIRFSSLDGIERSLKTDGEIRLRVITDSYYPLHNDPEDRFYKWKWQEERQTIKMTTGGRTYVSPKAKNVRGH